MTRAAILIPLILAALSPVFGYGWLGHGVYKLALLGLPFSGGRSALCIGAMNSVVLARAVAVGAALGSAGLGLAWACAGTLWEPTVMREALDTRFSYTPAAAVIAALFIATLNAVLEEWFYRGWLDHRSGVFISAMTFAAQHVIVLAPLVGSAPALCAGLAVVPAALAWSWLSRRDGWALAVVSHVVADIVLFSGGLRLLGYGL